MKKERLQLKKGGVCAGAILWEAEHYRNGMILNIGLFVAAFIFFYRGWSQAPRLPRHWSFYGIIAGILSLFVLAALCNTWRWRRLLRRPERSRMVRDLVLQMKDVDDRPLQELLDEIEQDLSRAKPSGELLAGERWLLAGRFLRRDQVHRIFRVNNSKGFFAQDLLVICKNGHKIIFPERWTSLKRLREELPEIPYGGPREYDIYYRMLQELRK